ncbi:MAG: PAS domain S-box protein [Myxococcales bacterium]
MPRLESIPAARDSEVQLASGNRYFALFEQMQEAVALCELVFGSEGRALDFRLVDLNDAFERALGVRRKDAMGQLASLIFDANAPFLLSDLDGVDKCGQPKQIQTFLVASQRSCDVSILALGFHMVALVLQDTTEHKSKLDRMERQHRALRTIVDHQGDPTWVKDEAGHYCVVNRAFATSVGLNSPDDTTGRSDDEILSRERAEQRRAAERLVITTGVSQLIEESISDDEGTHSWVTSLSPVATSGGSVCGILGASQKSERKSATQRSNENARDFEQIVDMAPDPIAIARSTGEALYVNRAFCVLTGYPHEELLGRHIFDIGVWDQPQSRQLAIAQLQSEGRFDCVEMVIVSPNGSRHCVEATGTMGEIGGRTVLIVSLRDVTENRRAKEDARSAAETLTRYCALSLDLLCIADRDARFRWLNPAWETTLGYALQDLQGARYLDFVHPDDVAETLEAMNRLSSGQRVLDLRNRYRRADGSWCWLEWRSVADERGTVHAVARDITERLVGQAALKAAERTTAASREQLLKVSELAHIGHFMIEFETGNLIWTPELYRIFGVEPGEFTPTLAFVRSCILDEDRTKLDAALETVVRQTGVQQLPLRFRRPTGETRFCHLIIEGVNHDETGTCVVGLMQDLTDIWRAETEQRRLQQQVMQAQKLESLGVLAGGIAHDFNNLLTSILGNADLAIRELAATDPARVFLTDIERVSRRAADLCRQMLAYSGKGRFIVQPFSVNDIVRAMAHLLSVSVSKRAELKYEMGKDLPSVVVDATQIRQVVMNLITNASEAIEKPDGVVTLSTGVLEYGTSDLQDVIGDGEMHAPGRYVYIEVRDTGCGMSPETLTRIFDPFFTTKFTGRGLGLAAVMGIVRGHKGLLQVRTKKGEGTCFKVLLPAEDVAAEAVEPVSGPSSSWRGSGLVLLVDDDESIRRTGRGLLEAAGFDVLTAADGWEALEQYRTHEGVRLVILDLTMPRLDGEGCFRELLRLDPQVRVIMASGYNEQDVVNRFRDKGPEGFVQKPYNTADLMPKIRKALRGRI